jgi:hypothetical protein
MDMFRCIYNDNTNVNDNREGKEMRMHENPFLMATGNDRALTFYSGGPPPPVYA